MPLRNPNTARWGQVFGAGAVLLGAAGLVGWELRLPVLASAHPLSRPIAPSAAAALAILGLVMVRLPAGRMGRPVRLLAGAVTGFIFLYGLLEVIGLFVGADLNREDVLTRRLSEAWSTAVVPMSSVAGALMLIVAAAMLALLWSAGGNTARGRSGDAAGALSALSVVVAAVFVLAYFHGVPLLRGSRALPIALTSASGFLLLGLGVVAAAGPACWPRRMWAGESVRARMLRAFVPLTVGVVLVSSFVCEQSFVLTHVNHALVASTVAVVFAVTVGAVVSRIAAAIGGATDRAQAALRESEEALRQSEERLHLALEAAQSGTWEWDLQTNENVWSEELWRLYGLEPRSREASYQAWRDSLHPDDRDRVERIVQDAARHGKDLNAEWRVHRPGGATRWLMSRGRPWRDAGGRIRRYLGVVIDITARKRSEEERERLIQALDQQARLLATVIENTEAHLVYLDPEFNFVWVNDAYAQSCRRSKEEFYGRNHFAFYPHEENEAIFRRVRDTGEPARYLEKPFEFPDMPERGVTYWDWTLTPVKDSAGRVEGLVFSLLDVTARVRQREQLLAAERARTELLATLNREISHRVKNNLAMMGGLLQLQATGARDPTVAEALRDAVVRLHSLAEVHDELSATPSGEVDVLAATRRIAARIQRAFETREVAVSVEGDSLLLPPRPASNLGVIANELITNALKHGAPAADGRLQVRVLLTRADGRVHLSVWNSGPPPPAESLRAKPGGLGLTVVQGLAVEQYRGTFTLAPRDAGTLAEVAVPEAALLEQE
jgi:PAS domain S-box-containing protein